MVQIVSGSRPVQYHPTLLSLGESEPDASIAGDFALNYVRAGKLAVAYDRTDDGRDIAYRFIKNPNIIERSDVVFIDALPESPQDYLAFTKTLASHHPDGIFFAGNAEQGKLFAENLQKMGLKTPVIFSGVRTQNFQAVASAAEGHYFLFPAASRLLKEKEVDITPLGVFAYVGTNLLLDAIQRSGTTDASKITNTLKGNQWNTVWGTVRFDPMGEITGSPYAVWDRTIPTARPVVQWPPVRK